MIATPSFQIQNWPIDKSRFPVSYELLREKIARLENDRPLVSWKAKLWAAAFRLPTTTRTVWHKLSSKTPPSGI